MPFSKSIHSFYLYFLLGYSHAVNTYGPQGMRRILDAAYGFMRFEKSGMRLFPHEFGKDCKSKAFEDTDMIVHPIPIYGMYIISLIKINVHSQQLLIKTIQRITHKNSDL